MRFPVLGPTAIALAAATLGCAQVAGIQGVSSSAAAQHCVDTANQLRAGAKLAPLDGEQCADELAQVEADSETNAPSCWTTQALATTAGSGMADPDDLLQQLVTGEWMAASHGVLGGTMYTQVACGYGTTSSESVGIMFLQ
jgi:hypothetical protein